MPRNEKKEINGEIKRENGIYVMYFWHFESHPIISLFIWKKKSNGIRQVFRFSALSHIKGF